MTQEPVWYHTIDLPGGVLTPGWFDCREPAATVVPWPDLRGARCLDVGTYDGFWAFEMERRGAAEVVAVDVLDPARWDWPHGSRPEVRSALEEPKRETTGFETAHAALGSNVQRRDLSVYELSPETVGTFDVVYLGSLLLHLRDPVGALERLRSVCTRDLVLVDAVDGWLSVVAPRRPRLALDGVGRPWWFKPNSAALARMVAAAGFEVVEGPRAFRMPFGARYERPRPSLRWLRAPSRGDAEAALLRGDPHAALRAQPR